MDLFDVAAKLSIDSSEYESGIASAIAGSGDMSEALAEMQTKYNQATAQAKIYQKALDEYVAETGSASGAGEELAAMLAEEQLKAQDAKESVEALKAAQDDAANSAEQAGEKASSFGQKIANAAKVGAAAFAAIGTASVAAIGTIGKLVTSTAEYGDNVDKMSQKMGISATAYQEWDAVMQHSGTSMETLKASMKTLATAAESGNDAFAKLGITQSDIANMNTEELFSATITALQNVDDETERTYLTGKLLGRGATELGALLNMSAEETEEMQQRVHELGGVMSDDAVKASAAFADNMKDLKTTISGLGRNIAAGFLPGVNDILAGFTSLIIGEEGAENKLTNGLTSITSTITNLAPKIVSVLSTLGNSIISIAPQLLSAGVLLVQSLVQSLVSNSGQLINAAISIIDTLASGLTSLAPLLLTGALQLIAQLASGLGQSLPTLIPAVVNIVVQSAQALTDPPALGAVLQGGISLIQGLASGLLSALPILINSIPVIIENLVNFIVQNAPSLIVAAGELIVQLAVGLVQAIPQLVSKIPEIIGALVSGIFDLAPELVKAGGKLMGSLWDGIKSIFGGKKSQVDVSQGFDFNSVQTQAQQTAASVDTAFSAMNTGLDFSATTASATTQFATLETSATTTKDSVVSTFTAMGTEASAAVSAASNGASADWSGIPNGAQAAAKKTVAAFKNLPSQFRAVWQQIKTIFNEVPIFFTRVFTVAKQNVLAAWSGVPTQFSAIWQQIKLVFDKPGTYSQWGSDMVQNFIDGINLKKSELYTLLNEMAGKIKAVLGHSHPTEGPMKDDYMWMPDMMNLFIGGIKQYTPKLHKTALEAFDLRGMMQYPIEDYTFSSSGNLAKQTVSVRNATDAKIDTLISLLRAYLPQLGNQQIVLDDGTLVGAMLPQIDAELGQSYLYKLRGNA